jgi:hypothetical protein
VFDRAGVEPSFEPADVNRVDYTELPAVKSDEELWTAIYERVARIAGGEGIHAKRLAVVGNLISVSEAAAERVTGNRPAVQTGRVAGHVRRASVL